MNRYDIADGRRREDLIRTIEHNIENLSLQELEAIYYDLVSKGYIEI
jgi:transposase